MQNLANVLVALSAGEVAAIDAEITWALLSRAKSAEVQVLLRHAIGVDTSKIWIVSRDLQP